MGAGGFGGRGVCLLGGRGRRGGGEETSDSSDEFCLVELKFFGGVEAAGVGEGGGEVVGGFGEVGGEREGGDGDDGVFDCGRGEDSAVEVKKEGWGWGGGEGSGRTMRSRPGLNKRGLILLGVSLNIGRKRERRLRKKRRIKRIRSLWKIRM